MFCPFSLFFYFTLFLENHSHKFFNRCSWYYAEGYLHKEIFSQHLLLWWDHFEIFWTHFGVFSSIREGCSKSYLIKFSTVVFCYTLTVNVLRKISQRVSFCWGHYAVFVELFWVHFSILGEI